MAVRKQCNRYRSEPYGDDFNEVLKRAKRFFKDGTFGIYKREEFTIWSTFRAACWGEPDNAIYYTKNGHKWEIDNKRERNGGNT